MRVRVCVHTHMQRHIDIISTTNIILEAKAHKSLRDLYIS